MYVYIFMDDFHIAWQPFRTVPRTLNDGSSAQEREGIIYTIADVSTHSQHMHITLYTKHYSGVSEVSGLIELKCRELKPNANEFPMKIENDD